MNHVTAICFLLVALPTGVVLASLAFHIARNLRSTPAGTRLWLFLLIALSATLLFRPHEDTFTGLDTSCYRLMTHAFTEGRGLRDSDQTLLSLPEALRRTVLLEYEHWGRDTRDRSFEIPNLATCVTRPYFYPTLPLAASGLQSLARIVKADYFVPLVGFLFFAVVLATGAAFANKSGLLAAAALLIGSPLPAYLLRGYYAEAVAAVLVMLVLLGRSLSIRNGSFRFAAPVVLGLSICFHPVLIALALPALALLLMDRSLSRRAILLTLVGFVAGLAPLYVMTRWICQPYGNFLNMGGILHNLSVDPVHRLLTIFIVIFASAIGLLLFGPIRLKDRLREQCIQLLDNRACYLLLLAGAALPLMIPASLWPGKALVMTGLHEYGDGIRWSYGLLLLAAITGSFRAATPRLSRALLLLAVLLSPLFFYLKGFELMGLWSQRRLIPLTLLLIVALTPALSSLLRSLTATKNKLFTSSIPVAVVMALALVNPVKWPTPYLQQHEHGASQWVDSIRQKMGTHFTIFDYYPYSVPFVVNGQTRAVGLSEFGYPGWPALASWLASTARQEPIWVVSAYTNPGLEDGLTLSEISHETFTTRRIVSKTALPAETRDRRFDMILLAANPITRREGLAVHKILDDGPLALRGNWGPGSVIRTGQDSLPSHWSRQGSGVIGPIPAAGRTVHVTITAAASRDDGIAGQVLRIHPPWGDPALSLTISNDLTTAHGILARPTTSRDSLPATGLYSFDAIMPYDPAKAGIRGYDKDLGARIHSITIECKD